MKFPSVDDHDESSSPNCTENFIELAGTVLVLSDGFVPSCSKNQKLADYPNENCWLPFTFIIVEILVLSDAVVYTNGVAAIEVVPQTLLLESIDDTSLTWSHDIWNPVFCPSFLS